MIPKEVLEQLEDGKDVKITRQEEDVNDLDSNGKPKVVYVEYTYRLSVMKLKKALPDIDDEISQKKAELEKLQLMKENIKEPEKELPVEPSEDDLKEEE